MNFFSKLASGISKGVAFVLHVFTQTQAVIGVITKLGPGTLSAILALFYDVMSTIISGGQDAEDLATGNFQASLAVSETTKTLLMKLAADFQNAEATVVADFKALGIAVKSPAAPSANAGLASAASIATQQKATA